MDTDETLDFSRDNDRYEALTYAVACSRRAHVGLHAFEAGPPSITCAEAIFGIVEIVSFLIDDLTAMVDRVRREGRAWTSLTLEEKEQTLRQAFEAAHQAEDFTSVTSVWWEPLELYERLPEPPPSGCPAWLALWDQLWPWKRLVVATTDPSDDAAASRREVLSRDVLRGTPSPVTPLSQPAEQDWDGLMREITRINESEDPDVSDGRG